MDLSSIRKLQEDNTLFYNGLIARLENGDLSALDDLPAPYIGRHKDEFLFFMRGLGDRKRHNKVQGVEIHYFAHNARLPQLAEYLGVPMNSREVSMVSAHEFFDISCNEGYQRFIKEKRRYSGLDGLLDTSIALHHLPGGTAAKMAYKRGIGKDDAFDLDYVKQALKVAQVLQINDVNIARVCCIDAFDNAVGEGSDNVPYRKAKAHFTADRLEGMAPELAEPIKALTYVKSEEFDEMLADFNRVLDRYAGFVDACVNKHFASAMYGAPHLMLHFPLRHFWQPEYGQEQETILLAPLPE